jgi:hypothetical protein
MLAQRLRGGSGAEPTRRQVERLGQQQVVGTGSGEESTGLGEEVDRFVDLAGVGGSSNRAFAPDVGET